MLVKFYFQDWRVKFYKRMLKGHAKKQGCCRGCTYGLPLIGPKPRRIVHPAVYVLRWQLNVLMYLGVSVGGCVCWIVMYHCKSGGRGFDYMVVKLAGIY